MAIINEKIKQRRLELGYTLLEMAEYLGVKEATAQRYESGAIKTIGHNTIIKLSDFLKCSPSYLMGWEDKKETSPALVLTDEETEIILAYRQADEVTRKMVLRSLDIEELLEYKKRNAPPAENLEILRKKA